MRRTYQCRKSSINLTDEQIVRKWSTRNARMRAPVTATLLWPDIDVDGIVPELYLKPIPHPQVEGIPPNGKEVPGDDPTALCYPSGFIWELPEPFSGICSSTACRRGCHHLSHPLHVQ